MGRKSSTHGLHQPCRKLSDTVEITPRRCCFGGVVVVVVVVKRKGEGGHQATLTNSTPSIMRLTLSLVMVKRRGGGVVHQATLTNSTPSIMRLTLSLVMAACPAIGMATSFKEWAYAIWSTRGMRRWMPLSRVRLYLPNLSTT